MKSIDWRSDTGLANEVVMTELNKLIEKLTQIESEKEGILHGISKHIDLILLTDIGQYSLFRDQVGYEWFKLPDGECRVVVCSPAVFIDELMKIDKKLRTDYIHERFSIDRDHDYDEVD